VVVQEQPEVYVGCRDVRVLHADLHASAESDEVEDRAATPATVWNRRYLMLLEQLLQVLF
jgi:hypothetical protein